MRLTRLVVSLPALWFLVVAAIPPSPVPPTPSPSPTPVSTPVAVNAFLSLDVTTGDPNTVIDVTGGQFLPNEQTTLYWDASNHVAGSATADSGGNFNVRVKPFAGDAAGLHKLCASVPPSPCAQFTLTAATPTPSPSATPAESPSPTPDAAATPLPITSRPNGTTINGLDVITRPPFVFLPLIGLVAIAIAIGYWIVSRVRRPRPVPIRSAAVVHRAMRPDYSAGFGSPAAAPAVGPAEPSPAPGPVPPAPAPQAVAPTLEEEFVAAEWGTGEPDSGYQFAPPDPARHPGEPPVPGD